MTTAKIILVEGTGLLAWLVKKFTNSKYSHCAFLIGENIYEADIPFVMKCPVIKYGLKYDVFEVNGMTEERSLGLLRSCIKQLGRPYDIGKVLGTGLDILFGSTFFRKFFNTKRAFTCVEFISNELSKVGLPLDKKGQLSSPGELITNSRLIGIKSR